jgi:hypothetical protein
MATLKFLDPRATVNPQERPLIAGLDSLEGKVIGIIDNGQANSTTMFQELTNLVQKGSSPSDIRPSQPICRVRLKP